jgi:phospholipid/cholesterol/gamma-HCH transport system substrate-binding protein
VKPLKERNQAAVGGVTLVLIVLAVLTAYFSDSLPIFGNGTTYTAYFAESAGLAPDNEVEVAGIKVGQITKVSLAGKKVLVKFRVKNTRVGDASTASIEIKTLLGEKFLALAPKGAGSQNPNDPIPMQRTRTPFQLQDAFQQLSTTVGDINTQQLAQSFTVLSDSLKDSPQYMKDALSGLSSLSKTVSSRDQQLHDLLSNTSQVSKTLADRNTQLQKVISDGNLLLGELQNRKDAISALLTGTQQLSAQLSGLVADNRQQLKPTLEKLGKVTDVLQRNQDNLARSLQLMAPFARIGANATGNGRWFEGYLCGLLPPTLTPLGMQINPEGCTPPIAAPDQGIGGR